MIAIITVNWRAYDFLDLLCESAERYSSLPYKIIVIDNSEERQEIRRQNVDQFFMPINIGHGRGLNHGVAKVHELYPKFPYVMFLDVDCHFLCHGWETPFIKMMRTYDLVGGRGVPSKPIRPACMFMKQPLSRHNWADSEGYRGNRQTPEGFDVAIKAYYQIMAAGKAIGFLETGPNRYGTNNGEEWCVEGKPVVYHHWHGSALDIRQPDFEIDLQADKAKLFSQIPWLLP